MLIVMISIQFHSIYPCCCCCTHLCTSLCLLLYQDSFAEWVFLNQCLYFNKGLSDYVAILHPHDFIVSGTSSPAANSIQQILASLDSIAAGSGSASAGNSVVHGARRLADDVSKPTDLTSVVGPAKRGHHLRGSSNVTGLATTRKSRLAAGGIPHAANLTGRPWESTSSQCHFYQLSSFGVQDPDTAFGSWGPADTAWTSGNFN
jgi:hypothetical protein